MKRQTRKKHLSRKELAKRRRALRDKGERVVLTNGCFDLIHVGHIRYLEAARHLGDALIVGVNSDESVRRLKGPGRPVTPAVERAEIVAALEAVDFVTIFEEDTATQLITELNPDLYVKGGDYSADPGSATFPVEGHFVLASGGRVEVIPYLEGHSTTELLDRLTGAPVPK